MNRLRTPLNEFQDKYHPINLYCRLQELGISEDDSWKIGEAYQRVFYQPILKFVKQKSERGCEIKNE